jgi:hypothetical protein
MRRATLFIVLLVTLAAPLAVAQEATDRRSEKRLLVLELLKTLDMKQFTQALLDVTFRMQVEEPEEPPAALTAEQRKTFLEEQEVERARMRKFRDRLYSRIDYDKIAAELYEPYFDKTFSADELRALIAFYKTKEGQKMARAMPELTLGSVVRTGTLLQELGTTIADEMEKEEAAKKPFSRAMADMRTMATASEAYAVDQDHYPSAANLSDLTAVLSPTYIRKLPEQDPWKTDYVYLASTDLKHYRIVSGGSNGIIEGSSRVLDPGATDRPPRVLDESGADIIFQDGTFVQVPAAAEREGAWQSN